ncbi:M81 family metallopeptidase [Devosia sp. YIM 151766]|uniref:M81 family metallopeptidase n=1 Tax=Devosia sp. YIM 151766 TaxID=3017325 RepID=UPI00255C7977|nr:M81 family metallopeptidase [Devosia sp. YIM 151766]WIY53958.1 M81 family metallopeptidase [Devosia sp. YIM 151766]
MSRRYRIAVGGFLHETNTFVPGRATQGSFQSGGGYPGMCFGNDVLSSLDGVNCGLAGFIEAARTDHELIPLSWAVAVPSGPVTDEAFEYITGKIVDTLKFDCEIDAVYLDLHGAMVTESRDDGDGEILRRVRAAIGEDIPIVASLDLHANVSPLMFQCADGLLSYQTYPHIDMAETGRRCFAFLKEALARGRRPYKLFRQLPFLIPTVAQCTLLEPAKGIYDQLIEFERREGVSSLSFNPGFPAADVKDCRPSVTGYGWDASEVATVTDGLLKLIEANEGAFNFPLLSPDEAVLDAMAHASPGGPVVIADTQDNPGGGSTSDTMGMLRALLRHNVENAAIGLIADPSAAETAHRSGVGATLKIALGGRGGFPGDEPLEGEFLVEALSQGEVKMSGGLYGYGTGQLGKSACLRIGGVQVAVSSVVSQMADQQMFRFVGIEPKERAVVVVKSTIHFRANFDTISTRTIVATAPGGMIADCSRLPWKNLPPDVRTMPMGKKLSERAIWT